MVVSSENVGLVVIPLFIVVSLCIAQVTWSLTFPWWLMAPLSIFRTCTISIQDQGYDPTALPILEIQQLLAIIGAFFPHFIVIFLSASVIILYLLSLKLRLHNYCFLLDDVTSEVCTKCSSISLHSLTMQIILHSADNTLPLRQDSFTLLTGTPPSAS